MLSTHSLADVISSVKKYLASSDCQQEYLANLDLLKLYGKTLSRENFYRHGLLLLSKYDEVATAKEIARFAFYVDKDSSLAQQYALKVISEEKNPPLWLRYIAKSRKTYYNKLCDEVFLTSIPKNASTSLKSMILEGVHKRKVKNPHAEFASPYFDDENNATLVDPKESDLKLVIVRDPVARFLSYYSKNIIEKSSLVKEVGGASLEKKYSISLKPDLDFFIENLGIYCYYFNDVAHHVLPQTAYFTTLKGYDHCVDIKDVHQLGLAVSEKLGISNQILPPRRMKSKKSILPSEISSKSLAKLERLFDDDIRMYNDRMSDFVEFSFNFDKDL